MKGKLKRRVLSWWGGWGWGWLENEKKKRCKGSYEDETG